MDARRCVAWNIRKIRVSKGLAQEALAVDAEIDRTYVSRLERGLENPTVAVLERVAAALDVSISAFFRVPKAGARPIAMLRRGRKPKHTGKIRS
ncbi:MAG: helix-turn-helix domain-containing protein [Alphaproteobacteria bacterium]